MRPETFLSGLGGGLRAFAPAFPGVWGTIVSGIGAGVGLVADLIAAGRDPVATIERIRAIDWTAADSRIDALIRERTGG